MTDLLYLMKIRNYFLSAFVIALGFLSCRGEDIEDLQRIDQVLHMYVKNAQGQDLLNSSLPGSYRKVELRDIGGLYDQSAVAGYTVKKDQDTVYYLEYKTGATRFLLDSASPDSKRYRSDMIVNYFAVNDTIQDTISITYQWTPQVFQIQNVQYNKSTVFTKVEGQPNVVKIVK